mmetsp:Transcript_65897/g.182161  ORF Transcript_65897/g.182161 Transcript_65897/m.182161 type:complete len:200 (+) Transcript_65897:256-855(+)
MIAVMLFMYMEIVGCYWSMDTPTFSSASWSGVCTSTYFYSRTFEASTIVLLVTKLTFIDSGLADLGHLLRMDVPTGPRVALLGLCGQCVCVLYFAATKENISMPNTDSALWLLFSAMLFVWLAAVALGAPWRALAEGTYLSPQYKSTMAVQSSLRIRRRLTRMRAAAATGDVEMREVGPSEETTTAVVTNPMVAMAQQH